MAGSLSNGNSFAILVCRHDRHGRFPFVAETQIAHFWGYSMVRLFLLSSFFALSALAHDTGDAGIFPGRIGNILAGSLYWHEVSTHPKLSKGAEALLRESLEGIPYIIDAHMHLAGTETKRTGCHVHRVEGEYRQAMEWVKQQTISAAAGIKTAEKPDDAVTARTMELVANFPYGVRYYSALLAFSPDLRPHVRQGQHVENVADGSKRLYVEGLRFVRWALHSDRLSSPLRLRCH
jgi:hypothetical protein